MQFVDRGDSLRLAFRKREGRGPKIVFLPGYASDMEGAKAVALDAFASEQRLPLLRFDYSGTGSSEGAFEDGTLTRWTDDAQLMLDMMTDTCTSAERSLSLRRNATSSGTVSSRSP